jgi:fumarate hydratase class II
MSGWANLLERDIKRLKSVEPELLELAIGGTAVGTGLKFPIPSLANERRERLRT